MNAHENPPGFIVRTEAQKAAFDNGFRIERGVENGWLRYASASANGEIWVAGASANGPWLLSISHPGVAAEIAPGTTAIDGPGVRTLECSSLAAFYAAIARVYQLGVSLPDAPLQTFRKASAGLPCARRSSASRSSASARTSSGSRCSLIGIIAVR